MTQTLYDYSYDAAIGQSGQISNTRYYPNILSRILSGGKRPQTVSPIAVGGTIGTETFTVNVPLTFADGTTFTATATVVGSATINTPALVEKALAVALQSIPEFDRVAIADSSSGNLVIRAKRAGENPIGTVTATATGSATITAAPTTTAAVTVAEIPFGFVVGETDEDSSNECRLFSAGARILGIALNVKTIEQTYPAPNFPINDVINPDRYREGDTVAILNFAQKGQSVFVLCNGTPTKNAVPNINNTTGQIQVAGGSGTTPLAGARFTGRFSGSIAEIEF